VRHTLYSWYWKHVNRIVWNVMWVPASPRPVVTWRPMCRTSNTIVTLSSRQWPNVPPNVRPRHEGPSNNNATYHPPCHPNRLCHQYRPWTSWTLPWVNGRLTLLGVLLLLRIRWIVIVIVTPTRRRRRRRRTTLPTLLPLLRLGRHGGGDEGGPPSRRLRRVLRRVVVLRVVVVGVW